MTAIARTSDPWTSHAAARKARELVHDHHHCILGVLWRPMHIYAIARLTGLTHVQVARRMPELEALGKVRVTGQSAPGPTGRECRLWERVA